MAQLEIKSTERMLLGAEVPGVDAKAPDTAMLIAAADSGLGSFGVLYEGWHMKVRQAYADKGIVYIVMEVDAAAAEACKEAPLLQLRLGSKHVQAKNWIKFTKAMVDGVSSAYAKAQPWHSQGKLVKLAIPAEDVDKVFKVLPKQCIAAIDPKRGARQCQNRASLFTQGRCHCHQDKDKYPEWSG
jgi:hypothetical protein